MAFALLTTLPAQSIYTTPYTVTTIAGSTTGGTADGTGSAARFTSPQGIALDDAGNLFVAEPTSRTIRKITPAGVVTTLAGTAHTFPAIVDDIGSAARFISPSWIAVDGANQIYVGEEGGTRKITPAGAVTTFSSFGVGGGGGAGIAAAQGGDVYRVRGRLIYKITTAGSVISLAGSDSSPSVDGQGSAAGFNNPAGLAVDELGLVYVAEEGGRKIRKITPEGVVTTLAGTTADYSPADGPGATARFQNPTGIAVDQAGNVFISEFQHHTIRRITADGVVSTIAGLNGAWSDGVPIDGVGAAARFSNPCGIAVDSTGNIYVADVYNHRIRKCAPPNAIPTITLQPASQAAMPGSTVTLIAGATGGPTPTFQWQRNGLNIAGATKRFLTLHAVEPADAGEYSVIASNVHASVTSNIAVLSITRSRSDFNGDGKPDILWQHAVTGQRYLWFMNGATTIGDADLGVVAPDWHIAVADDFNGDGKPDILWQHAVTGQRYLWFMNGATTIGDADLGVVAADWMIIN